MADHRFTGTVLIHPILNCSSRTVVAILHLRYLKSFINLLYSAALEGNANICHILIKAGIDPNVRDLSG